MVVGTLILGYVLGVKTTKMDINLDNLNTIYVCLAAVGILVSTYLCAYDEKTKGNLNVATFDDMQSDQLSEQDERSLSEKIPIRVTALDR
jgi:hypothetical protein